MFSMLIFLFMHLLTAAMETEQTPLIQPAHIRMIENQKLPILYTQTRQFFDDASSIKFRNKLIKKCLCNTLGAGIGIGCVGSGIGALGATVSYACGCTSGACIPGLCGMFAEWILYSTCPIFVIGIAASSWASGIKNRLHQIKIKWDEKAEVSHEMITTAQSTKYIWIHPKTISGFVQRAQNKECLNDCLFDFIHKIFTCSYAKEKKYLNHIEKRFEKKIIMRTLLAHHFYTENEHRLPKDIIKKIFSYINFKEFENYSYLTEKELVFLLRDLPYNQFCHDTFYTYAYQGMLEARGWISFKRSEKYPIQCEVQYFDANIIQGVAQRITETAMDVYGAQTGQTMYLPYSLELARYYKFEEDPAYKKEYVHPSCTKIGTLLEQREKIAPRKVDSLTERKN